MSLFPRVLFSQATPVRAAIFMEGLICSQLHQHLLHMCSTGPVLLVIQRKKNSNSIKIT